MPQTIGWIKNIYEIPNSLAIWDCSIQSSIITSWNNVTKIVDNTGNWYDMDYNSGNYATLDGKGITLNNSEYRTIPTPFTADNDFTIILVLTQESADYQLQWLAFTNKDYFNTSWEWVSIGNIASPQVLFGDLNTSSSHPQSTIINSNSYNKRMVGLSRDGSTLEFIRDGSVFTTRNITWTVSDEYNNFRLWRTDWKEWNGVFFFGGVWERALTNVEISNIYSYLQILFSAT